MEIDKMLDELRTERQAVNEAIMVLENMARGRGKRRGRPAEVDVRSQTPRKTAGE